MHPLLALLASYLLGSIPTAYMAGRITRGIDLREHGSGNLGATNVFRVLGWKLGLLVLAVDLSKGALPVWLFSPERATGDPGFWPIAFGVAAILGHVRPVFLLWRGGGKGVATAGGVFLALAPLPTLLATAGWLVVLLLTGYVSLASLTAAALLPVGLLVAHGVESPLFLVSAAVGLFVLWAHRGNLARLRRGEEHRLGRKKAAT